MGVIQLSEAERRNISGLIRVNMPVLICLCDPQTEQEMVGLVRELGGIPVVLGSDRRWKTLFRQAFSSRVSAVIGDPMVVLGLAKLTRAYGTSLKILTAILLGGHGSKWLAEDIRIYLDCAVHWIGCTADDREDVLIRLEQELLSWTSILDCRLEKTEAGLELQIVAFSGERIPRLPSCARLVISEWNPEKDIPFVL